MRNFERLADAHRLKNPIREAVRLVFSGLSAYEAARVTGVSQAGISRAMARIRKADGKCPCCGKPI